MFRQGDVLVTPIGPAGSAVVGEKIVREGGRVVLAHGELTGHAHAIRAPEADLYEIVGGGPGRVLRITALGGADLEHEEHSTIHLSAGDYRVTRQREYRPEEVVDVAD